LLDLLAVELAKRTTPMFVALDGRNCSGKSTVAALVAERLSGDVTATSLVTVIEGDQFMRAAARRLGSGRSWISSEAVVRGRGMPSTGIRGLGFRRRAPWPEPIRSVVAPLVILEDHYFGSVMPPQRFDLVLSWT
jgi:hypothetical protein